MDGARSRYSQEHTRLSMFAATRGLINSRITNNLGFNKLTDEGFVTNVKTNECIIRMVIGHEVT